MSTISQALIFVTRSRSWSFVERPGALLFSSFLVAQLVSGMIKAYLEYVQRITADAALDHEWFREVPLPKSKDFMPTFPAQHAQDRYLNYRCQNIDI